MRKVLLTTDLYHPHADSNDHWNLATLYGMAMQKMIKLCGILCDEDKPDCARGMRFGDPAVQAIAQMNYITGLAVPQAVGSHKPIKSDKDIEDILNSETIIPSVNHILAVLEEGGEIDIHLCGSCRDIVLAYCKRPDLFGENVRIFLNAGTYEDQSPLEYNVSLEPFAFYKIFEMPCKIMWAPCFAGLVEGKFLKVGKHANYYWIEHEKVLPFLSRQMKNYFNYMYSHENRVGWLTYIQQDVDTDVFDRFNTGERQMWSTPGYLMSAGISLRNDGSVTKEDAEDALFKYVPAIVKCNPNGTLEWRLAEKNEKTNVSIFTISDIKSFQPVMAQAVKRILVNLP